VRVTNETIAGGFAAQPGSRVDLIYNIRKGTDEETHSGILLEDVLVLAADQIKDRVEGSGAITASVVTLALKPEDVLKVDLALAQGQIRLVLRKFDDKSLSDTTKVSLKDMVSNRGSKEKEREKAKEDLAANLPPATTPAVPQVPEATKVAPPRPKYQKHVVTVVKGNQTTRQIFFLNEAGEVVDEETVRQELEAAEAQQPATPPAVVNPQPSAAPMAPNGVKGGTKKNTVGV
jgi:Flp pilus assembly protein CpaB